MHGFTCLLRRVVVSIASSAVEGSTLYSEAEDLRFLNIPCVPSFRRSAQFIPKTERANLIDSTVQSCQISGVRPGRQTALWFPNGHKVEEAVPTGRELYRGINFFPSPSILENGLRYNMDIRPCFQID